MPNNVATNTYQNIPTELRQPPLWLEYYLKPNPQKPDKKPTKHPCVKWSTPELRKANLRSLDHLLERNPKAAGFQRYIDKDEGFVYIDLDDARNEAGEIEPWAQAIVNELDTYCEISASGKGLHLVCRGILPEDFHVDPNNVEVYSGNSGKLLAMTGNVLDWHTKVEDRQHQVEALLRKVKSEVTLETKKDAAQPERSWREVFHTGAELDCAPSRVFIEGILGEGITFFGGLSDSGKTWIGLSIAHALLSGEPLFGIYPVLQRAPVLYLVPEMGGATLLKRMKKMRISMDGGFFCQTIRDGACNLEDPLLLQAIHMTRAAVILDTAIRFQHGDEQSSTQQAQGLGAKLFRLIREGAAVVICMHHRKKDVQDTEPDLENTLRGTGDFGAMADCVWCVEHAKQKSGKPDGKKDYLAESKQLTRLQLTCVKPRDMEPADPFIIQGRPYIDQRGDFAVLDSHRDDQQPAAPSHDTDGDDSRVIDIVKAQPAIGQLAIRRQTGFGTDRINRILKAQGWAKSNGIWQQPILPTGPS